MSKPETTSIRFHHVPGTALLTSFHATLKYPKRKVQVVGVTKPKQTKPARQHAPACLSQAPSNFNPQYPEVHVQKEKEKEKEKNGVQIFLLLEPMCWFLEVPRTTHSELEDHDLLQRPPASTYRHVVDTLRFRSYEENFPKVHSGRGGGLGQPLGEEGKRALPRRPATA